MIYYFYYKEQNVTKVFQLCFNITYVLSDDHLFLDKNLTMGIKTKFFFHET